MAAVLYTDGTQRDQTLTPESQLITWISPASMDSADTVVVPTITGKTLHVLSAFDNTTGDSVTASVVAYTITVDAAGATANHVYAIIFTYV